MRYDRERGKERRGEGGESDGEGECRGRVPRESVGGMSRGEGEEEGEEKVGDANIL